MRARQRPPSSVTDAQIRELLAYARHVGDPTLEVKCAMALDPSRRRASVVDLTRAHCESAHARAVQSPAWATRHLPRGALHAAEAIARFALEEARELRERRPDAGDALVELARKIQAGDWIPRGEPGR